MPKWRCTDCGFIYDDLDEGSETPFVDLEDDWSCPDCGMPKWAFKKRGY